jgi:hypothetical protein
MFVTGEYPGIALGEDTLVEVVTVALVEVTTTAVDLVAVTATFEVDAAVVVFTLVADVA